MNNLPKKHHYIPEFYQKGFCSEEGVLYTYKKTYGEIKKRNPSQILYKEHLHTLTTKNNNTIMIEEFYSQIEGEFAKYIAFIKSSVADKQPINGLMRDADFMRLAKFLVATQFWRTPCNKNLAIEYTPKILSLYDKSNKEIKSMLGFDRKLIKSISQNKRNNNALKIIQFLLLPLLSFDYSTNVNNIYIFKPLAGKYLFSSDRPVIYDSLEKLFAFNTFYFPFSKDLLLFASEKEIPTIQTDKINLLIARKAKEFVISGSLSQLEELKSTTKTSVTPKAHLI